MIVLSTLNARYAHSSLGLRYLRANLGEYRELSQIVEFTIKKPVEEIVNELLALRPRLIGFGVYIWNTQQTLEVVKVLKQKAPEVLLVLGGPEISYETETQELTTLVDYVFVGESDLSFKTFIADWMKGLPLPQQKILTNEIPKISEIQFPYSEYTDEDVRHRKIYVEASRGCPYKCEYCLSSLDKSVRNFALADFLAEMKLLLDRGVRQFKFVDRTFNLAPTTSTGILQFFLDHVELGLFLHFEMVPDRLPDELKSLIEKFPKGSLQFEIGIQTWSTSVAHNVSRRQNYQKIKENLTYLHQRTGVHTHADLIVGLPGETWESFAQGFDELFALSPDEIQVGLLKRLKGTPIIRHDQKFAMVYSPEPPFQILQNSTLDKVQMEQLKIFADLWDVVVNSGRFPKIKQLPGVLQASPFEVFFEMSQWLYRYFERTHSIHLNELQGALHEYLVFQGFDKTLAEPAVRPQKVGNLPERQAMHLTAETALV